MKTGRKILITAILSLSAAAGAAAPAGALAAGTSVVVAGAQPPATHFYG